MIAKYNYKKQFNTYQIFIPDVDGLISGSPVRLMGIQIGYVTQIDIVGDDVYVKFLVTDSGVKIPYGSSATVEFSGLGGSKSLEIYPPDGKFHNRDNFINVQSPKRIHDSASLLNEMLDKIAEIAYTVSSFMDKVGIINPEKVYNVNKNTKSVKEVLNASDCWLNRAQTQTDKLGNKLKNIKECRKNGKKFKPDADSVEQREDKNN